VYLPFGIKPEARKEILGFWLFGAEWKSATDWKEVLKDLERCGVQRIRIFVTDDFPAWRRGFPQAARAFVSSMPCGMR
jgi:transposase-like protein